MEHAAGPPNRWRVLLNDGSIVEVWADSLKGVAGPDDDRDYAFGCPMDIDPAVQGDFEISARTPSDPRRVEVLVADSHELHSATYSDHLDLPRTVHSAGDPAELPMF